MRRLGEERGSRVRSAAGAFMALRPSRRRAEPPSIDSGRCARARPRRASPRRSPAPGTACSRRAGTPPSNRRPQASPKGTTAASRRAGAAARTAAGDADRSPARGARPAPRVRADRTRGRGRRARRQCHADRAARRPRTRLAAMTDSGTELRAARRRRARSSCAGRSPTGSEVEPLVRLEDRAPHAADGLDRDPGARGRDRRQRLVKSSRGSPPAPRRQQHRARHELEDDDVGGVAPRARERSRATSRADRSSVPEPARAERPVRLSANMNAPEPGRGRSRAPSSRRSTSA